jgi:transposase
MQLSILHKKLYHVARIDETKYSEKVDARLEKITGFKKLRSEGCSFKTACSVLKVPQSTVYRWKNNYKKFGLTGLEDESKRPNKTRQTQWKQHVVQQILDLRKSHPVYGKNKIAILLKRDHRLNISISTVGRIIQHLVKRDQIKPVSFYWKRRTIRPRIFNNHAKR